MALHHFRLVFEPHGRKAAPMRKNELRDAEKRFILFVFRAFPFLLALRISFPQDFRLGKSSFNRMLEKWATIRHFSASARPFLRAERVQRS